MTMGVVGGQLRVAIVSKHASARFGGEAILPLHYFRKLSELGHDVVLVVHERTREELLNTLGETEFAQVHFTPDTRLHRTFWRVSQYLPNRIANLLCGIPMDLYTQVQQVRLLRAINAIKAFDVIHQPIPVSPKLPSFTFGLGIPVVFGPMNGGMTFPKSFRDMASPIEALFSNLARSFASLANRLIPGKRRAALLLVANERTRQALPKYLQSKTKLLVENGVDLKVWNKSQDSATATNENMFLFMGRLIELKCVDLLLRAFAKTVAV